MSFFPRGPNATPNQVRNFFPPGNDIRPPFNNVQNNNGSSNFPMNTNDGAQRFPYGYPSTMSAPNQSWPTSQQPTTSQDTSKQQPSASFDSSSMSSPRPFLPPMMFSNPMQGPLMFPGGQYMGGFPGGSMSFSQPTGFFPNVGGFQGGAGSAAGASEATVTTSKNAASVSTPAQDSSQQRPVLPNQVRTRGSFPRFIYKMLLKNSNVIQTEERFL